MVGVVGTSAPLRRPYGGQVSPRVTGSGALDLRGGHTEAGTPGSGISQLLSIPAHVVAGISSLVSTVADLVAKLGALARTGGGGIGLLPSTGISLLALLLGLLMTVSGLCTRAAAAVAARTR